MANTSKGRFPSYGLVRGPSHSQGGVPASVANGPDVELEGGEFIIPKEAVPDYLPVLQQITQVGRDRQQMQNGNTAIDALIASASMQNGIAQPKSPVYQEGGQVQSKTLRGSRVVSRDIGRDGDMFTGQVIMAIPADQVGEGDGLRYYLSEPRQSQSMSLLDRKAQSSARRKMAFAPQDSLPADLVEGYFDRQNKTSILDMDNEKSPLGFLKNLIGKEQGGMVQYEEGGEVHSRRMYNQGTGFDKKKSDLDGDGEISEYERKRGMAIAKAMGKMQEGGMVADKTRVSQTYYPSEGLNLPMANLASPMNVGSVSQAPMSNEDIAQIVMDTAMPGAAIGSILKRTTRPSFSNLKKLSEDVKKLDKEILRVEKGERIKGDFSKQELPFYKSLRNIEAKNFYRNQNKVIDEILKDYSVGNMQMGGMVDGQPMMQRPMNPAMNFSPMQRMNPRMYQEGGQVQPRKQFELRNPETFIGPPDSLIGRVYMNPFTGEFEDADAQDKRIEEQIKRLRQRMKQSEIPISKERVPMQEGGQVNVNSRMGTTVSAKDLGLKNLGEVTSIPPQFQMSRPEFEAILNYGNNSQQDEITQEEKMANFMSLLENEKRVRPIPPDKYIVKDGVMSEVEINVPKLTSAYMSSYGIATPLSRNQGRMLQRKMIAPETLNPQVKGLLNRILVQRLAAEEN